MNRFKMVLRSIPIDYEFLTIHFILLQAFRINMTEYIILFVTMLIIYFVLVRNRTTPKTDWETLPQFEHYKKDKKASNEQQETTCIHCGSDKIIEKPLKDKKENPKQTKFYHTCTECRVILWRNEL